MANQPVPKETLTPRRSFLALQPHQQRVVEEHQEEAGKLDRLRAFIAGEKFQSVAFAERRRLRRQVKIMELFVDVLLERIDNF